MKRTQWIWFTLTLLFFLACKEHPVAQPAGKLSSKSVTITISSAAVGCAIGKPSQDPIRLKKNQDKIKWCVVYNCQANQATVVFDDFHTLDTTPVRNPFGNHSDAENTFTFGPLNSGGRDCDKLSGFGSITGAFKYRIRVIGPTGTVLAEMDPGVIITD
jgi:hypothetical protein